MLQASILVPVIVPLDACFLDVFYVITQFSRERILLINLSEPCVNLLDHLTKM